MTNYCHLSYEDRKNIEDGLNNNKSINKIAKEINRCHSSILREVDRNKIYFKPKQYGNYNPEYGFINAECCQHLIRDLQKVKVNIPNREWCDKVIKLFQEYDHKRNELIKREVDTFTSEEINEFILKLDHYLIQGIEENEKDSTPYYADKELTLICRIMEYRDNYIYWILDFDIPFTNNLSERNLRGIKTKMKVSGQFQNINSAKDYANIRSYIETCRLYGKNEVDSLICLVNGKPYSFVELVASKN